MKTEKLSRRRLLGSLLAAVTGCFLPKRLRASAAPSRPTPPARHAPDGYPAIVIYNYDGYGRLLSFTYQPRSDSDNGSSFSLGWSRELQSDRTIYNDGGSDFHSSERGTQRG